MPDPRRNRCAICEGVGARTEQNGRLVHAYCVNKPKARQRQARAEREERIASIQPAKFRTQLAPGVAWPYQPTGE